MHFPIEVYVLVVCLACREKRPKWMRVGKIIIGIIKNPAGWKDVQRH